ncbi:spike base protein, RCAP_Rcc01079 family [Methylocaldum sp.]|uniref:spike base protein, RCAP_Rcc01079 family n=1 Tax=Methylocaldum sp. TaxID=1969727 RepID=UPI002D6F4E3F|nr:hypothetical protein [Methylocaldum sp.]HYE38233.1 hypothetical protein [Methylocaldum sp.]
MSYPHAFLPRGGYAVTPSDADANAGIGFRVGGAGDVALTCADGQDLIIPDLLAGETVGIEFTKVLSTGTTATDIIAFRR